MKKKSTSNYVGQAFNPIKNRVGGDFISADFGFYCMV